jgi:hypothetical protein
MFAELSVSDSMFNRHGHLIPVCLFRWFCGYPYDHKPKVDRIIDSLICIVSDFGFVYLGNDAVSDCMTHSHESAQICTKMCHALR